MKPIVTPEQRLDALSDARHDEGGIPLLGYGHKIGLEREALRVNAEGVLAQTSHPRVLGAALTHPAITTDYSEAQLEFITPPLSSASEALTFLQDLTAYVSQRLEEDSLWANSMPCVMESGNGVPIAQYGKSNAGRMRTIYRHGLGHRYGRAMQAISGVHFNYSFNPRIWDRLGELAGYEKSDKTFQARAYMGIIRNLLRLSWVVPYLFGASPTTCKAFTGAATGLEVYDASTLYAPHATSLRMGDIGYQNNEKTSTSIVVSYNSLSEYIAALRYAVSTPCADYEAIGIKKQGQYQQLNTNILQIENEYYATLRPKRRPQTGEMPLLALHRRGVEYIELRTLDINPFEPAGVDSAQLYFLEALFFWCLINDSPPLSDTEQAACAHNEILVAHRGRDPMLRLDCQGIATQVKVWGETICEAMHPVCVCLDQAHQTTRYSDALALQQTAFGDPTLTPSAKVLDMMRANNEGFVEFGLRQTKAFHQLLSTRQVESGQQQHWDLLAQQSIKQQAQQEVDDNLSLEQYIQNYLDQLKNT